MTNPDPLDASDISWPSTDLSNVKVLSIVTDDFVIDFDVDSSAQDASRTVQVEWTAAGLATVTVLDESGERHD